MKTRNLIIGLLTLAVMFLTSCEDNNVNPDNKDYGILPERFKVDIPSSISNEIKSASLKSTQGDTLSGNDIYEHLTNFIAVGEGAADITEHVIWAIAAYKIDQIKELTYISDDDAREKKLVVSPNVDYDGRSWEYQLTITDELYKGNKDGGVAMQVFWNKSIIEGICLIKPSNLDVKQDANLKEAMFSIEYSERAKDGYEAYMIIEIAGLPLSKDVYDVDALKMFVGKKGNMVDVYGNSNHPNAKFNLHDKVSGFNWAFVASGHDTKDIGVAEVGLPLSTSDITSREAILVNNSVKSVLTREMTNYLITEFPALVGQEELVSTALQPYLTNADAPGFFNKGGFVQAATAPSAEYDELVTRVKRLSPYNPKSIAELEVSFK